jgi:demethylmenaquinone methyltransferase/2-methoxy-6-polyprenyl-1,4-benzoquinol methylase
MSEGATPPGARDEQQASRWVRRMFGDVAGRYDFLNHLLSFQVDRYWRARTVRRVRDILRRSDARVMDMCCGPGDLLLALQAEHPGSAALGSDFCHPMLIAAAAKAAKRGAPCLLFEADALALPLKDASLDLVTAAFGFRNLANYRRGLEEMFRVLRPGGVAAILEFSQPPNAFFAALYRFYSHRVLPAIGGAISGSKTAYEYLPESVRKFPGAEALAESMRETGFSRVEFERMTGGIVALHLATK